MDIREKITYLSKQLNAVTGIPLFVVSMSDEGLLSKGVIITSQNYVLSVTESERPETIVFPFSSMGDVSNTRKLRLENTCKVYQIVAFYHSIILLTRIQL